MARYKFPKKSIELVDPTFVVVGSDVGKPEIGNFDVLNLTYSAKILLTTPDGTTALETINNVKAESFNLQSDYGKMHQQILDALNAQFLVVE